MLPVGGVRGGASMLAAAWAWCAVSATAASGASRLAVMPASRVTGAMAISRAGGKHEQDAPLGTTVVGSRPLTAASS